MNIFFMFSHVPFYPIFGIPWDPTSWTPIPGSNTLHSVPGLLGLTSLLIATHLSLLDLGVVLIGPIIVLLVIAMIFHVYFHIVQGIFCHSKDWTDKL